ncbi:MAG: hypothetical protein ACYDA4_16905 [Ignavibacteriaceae bacterium]
MPIKIAFDFPLFIFLVIAAAIDLIARWIAFERIDSIAIDISIFSLLVTAIEMLKYNVNTNNIWAVKFIMGLAVLLGLISLHRWLCTKLDDKVRDSFNSFYNSISNNAAQAYLFEQSIIVQYAIDVALSERKYGKKARREKITKAINTTVKKLHGGDPISDGVMLSQESLLIEKQFRRWMILVFAGGGLIAIFIPVMTISFI